MMNRIDKLFSQRKKNVLSIFFTAGYPTLGDTVEIALRLAEAFVDMIEIGIPYSDPVADGPVIQQCNQTALKQGITLTIILEQVKAIRQHSQIPIILMGYVNSVMQYGVEKFCKDAADAGVDGVILPDLPLDEYVANYEALFSAHRICFPLLVAPTTAPERIREIARYAKGFIYAVSSSATTGTQEDFSREQETYFKRLAEQIAAAIPIVYGFGISNQKTFDMACRYGTGAIVGSAFLKYLMQDPENKRDVARFVRQIRPVAI